ncbi:hypothetical protein [Beduinella massiliensis]|uniref:hypothetical protein n=1 Tax=Beduinella massiliensis TaxID=1852363 RepID=UPI000C8521F7
MKRILALLLAVVLTGAFTFAAVAEAEIMPRASEYFSSYSVGITPKAGGKLSVRFSTTGVETSSTLGVTTYQLQKKVDGVFQNVGDEQSGSVGHSTIEHTFTRTCQGVAGEIYRVKATFVCENSKGYKTQVYYSSSAKAIN